MRRRLSRLQAAAVLGFAALIITILPPGSTNAEGYEVAVPVGIPRDVWSYFIPTDNPLTPSKIELGRRLFFDKRLSADGTISCASCHDPALAFADGKRVAEGIAGRRGTRNSPTLLNAMFSSSLFWDGRAQSLEAQAKLPLINPDEMGDQTYEQVVRRLQTDAEYAAYFREAFGGPITTDSIGKAIASFERTLVSGNSPYDRYVGGDREALSSSAFRGLALFRTKARCVICHRVDAAFPFFTDLNYRNTGVAVNNPKFVPLAGRAMDLARIDASTAFVRGLATVDGVHELGRFLITGNVLDIGAYRTPSLRNVELTGPYFHDGSAATLNEVVRFYTHGGNDNPARDWELQPVALTEDEQADLIEFLKSLTSDDARRPTPPR
jgi:cytochrome c peroxidase